MDITVFPSTDWVSGITPRALLRVTRWGATVVGRQNPLSEMFWYKVWYIRIDMYVWRLSGPRLASPV